MNYIEHLFINIKYQNNNFHNFYSELANEIKSLRENYHLQVKTIYIATDDFLLLTKQELISFLALVKEFTSENISEYSFEIGYQTLKADQLEILKQFQVNRLVWKVRTFNQSLLLALDKKFASKKIIDLVKKGHDLDFDNFSIDLENNISGQTEKDIIADLKIAMNLKAPHISYQSHNEMHNYENKRMIKQFLNQYDYQNYEFFSFATAKKYYSQQTLAYLTLKNWYGLGPGSSTFFKLNQTFIAITNNDEVPWVKETTTLKSSEYYQLLVTQGLMREKGINLIKYEELKKQSFWIQIIKLINEGYLQIENNYLKATNQGWDLLNDVLVGIINST